MIATTRPRLVVEITIEQRDILKKYFAYGEQRRVFQAILNDVVILLTEFGYDFASMMLRREFSYRVLMEEYEARKFADHAPGMHDN